MTKEEFIERIDKIKAFEKKQGDLQCTINSVLCESSSASVVDFGDEIINAWLKDIATLSDISFDNICWFIYEGGGICRYKQDGFLMNVKTASDFWDFEKHKIKK